MRGALPGDLGFYCGVPGHLIFPPGQAQETNLPRAGHKCIGGGRVGGCVAGLEAVWLKLEVITRLENLNAIRQRRDRDTHRRKERN